MAIIVEGFDNSGKSTLAASFGLEVLHPGPRPLNAMGELRCMLDQLRNAHRPVVMDRVTSISTPCYSGHFGSDYRKNLDLMLGIRHCVLIYCRPPIEVIKDFSNHVAKSYDDETKIKWLHDNAEAIVSRYDLYMSVLPHAVYDYTKPELFSINLALKSQSDIRSWELWNFLTTQ